jgi:hypothetical protein
VNLEEDEEEMRRLDNIDNSFIPFSMSNQIDEKRYQQIDTQQLEYMERLLNNRTAILSDDVVLSFKDLWAKSINKEQRQDLYRYWLSKYVQILTGLTGMLFFVKYESEKYLAEVSIFIADSFNHSIFIQ